MARNESARVLDAWAQRIEHLAALDRLTKPLSALAGLLRRDQRVTDVLSGTPIGHPLHPLLVTVPIGGWTGAFVLDLLGNRRGARAMVGLAILAALPAAAAGLSDWKDTSGGEQRVGVAHATLNTAVLSLYCASWVARRRGHHIRGFLWSLPALGMLGASGWLGGHLAYARGVGVDTTAFAAGAEDWVEVADAGGVVYGQLSVVEVAGLPVLLTRTAAGQLVAYADRCTHRGGPLHEGELVDGCVECPWHGSRFDLTDGSVVHGPATRPQPAYEVRVLDDRVLIRHAAEQRSLQRDAV